MFGCDRAGSSAMASAAADQGLVDPGRVAELNPAQLPGEKETDGRPADFHLSLEEQGVQHDETAGKSTP